LREAGVTLLLLYRTREFRTHFLRHPNELATVLSWNQLHHPRLQHLRLRAIAQAGGDFSGRCDLEDQDFLHRLHIPQGVIWRDDLSDWGDSTEKNSYLANQSIEAVSGKSNTHILPHGIKGDIDGNKSIYVTMIRRHGNGCASVREPISAPFPTLAFLKRHRNGYASVREPNSFSNAGVSET
jgi:hypothetical protein